VTLIIAQEGNGAMHSLKGVIASLVLLIGLLPATARTQVLDKNALTVNGTQQSMAAAVVKAKKVNLANSLGAAAPEASSSRVTYFDSKTVAAAAARTPPGMLYYGDKEGDKQIYALGFSGGDKESPQIQTFTHVFYVLQGSATLVTGGTLVDPKPTTPTRIRGTAIEGGETHHLSKGDVIIVPAGTPHGWKEFQEDPPLIYFVVNIR
jgi:mannose-6-phosphate isomerase-like protein (cupin superfamily)